MMANEKLTHFDESGKARMVDVGDKSETKRIAVASGRISMNPETADVIRAGTAAKGDVLGVARVAGIMAAKRTWELVPMCHPLLLTKVLLDLTVNGNGVDIEATVETRGKTGVEMEALTAVSVAALTVYDMVKAIDRGMTIEAIRLDEKHGGASGDWVRSGA
jgi:cyclic pyranopterin phosphate synthase